MGPHVIISKDEIHNISVEFCIEQLKEILAQKVILRKDLDMMSPYGYAVRESVIESKIEELKSWRRK